MLSHTMKSILPACTNPLQHSFIIPQHEIQHQPFHTAHSHRYHHIHIQFFLLEITCGEPPLVDNVKTMFNESLVGSMALYYCKERFRHVSGKNISICREDGKWDADVDIYCEGKILMYCYCPLPKEEDIGIGLVHLCACVSPSEVHRNFFIVYISTKYSSGMMSCLF